MRAYEKLNEIVPFEGLKEMLEPPPNPEPVDPDRPLTFEDFSHDIYVVPEIDEACRKVYSDYVKMVIPEPTKEQIEGWKKHLEMCYAPTLPIVGWV